MSIFEQIKIGSSFDAKGFKQAETATQKLNSGVKNLARTFGVAFGTAAVVAYGKASVKAFIEDENAARSLGITLKNLGLETGNTSSYVNEMISNLEKQTGVLDDQLRPAMDRLLRATSSVSKATSLLNLALDISAGTGKDLTTVSQGLQKAYLGNNASLGRLGVGLSKAELTSSSFEEIQIRLAQLFAGQASSAAESYAGQLNKLTIAGNNAKEVIGKGIVQALTESSGSINDATSDIERYSEAISNLIVDFGRFIRLSNAVPTIFELLTNPVDAINNFNKVADQIDAQIAAQNRAAMGKNPIQAGSYLKTQTKITKLTKEEAAAAAKILANKKLSAAIDKANLALAKGTDVFDMDKIQLNAAMLNQAEQLGKVNNQAQLLGITNDITRLKIKQDILNLEDAIASKDTARIEAATKQLNEDLKILGTLQNQNIKLADIKSILDKIVPKDLINLANLDAAIAKLNAMNAITGQPKISGTGTTTSAVSPAGIPIGDFVPKIPTSGVSMAAIEEFAAAATARANAMADLLDAQNAADAAAFANSSLNSFNITINTGVGDPNAIAETLDQYLQGAVDRGTLRLR
jgi:hypothetical protein